MSEDLPLQGERGRYRLAVAALGSMGIVYFFSYFYRSGIPGTIFNELQSDLRLSASAVAGLGSIFLLIYALMQLVVGLAADRFGGGRTLVFGGVFMGLGALMFSRAQSLWTLNIAQALTGFGASFMYLSVLKEASRFFGPRHFPVVIGMTLAFGYAGGISAMLPFERIVSLLCWRSALWYIGFIALFFVGLSSLLLRRMDPYPLQKGGFTLAPLWKVLTNPHMRPLFIFHSINFPTYFVMQCTLGKKFLEDFAGMSSPRAATFTMIMTIVSCSAVLTGGFVPAWCGYRRKPMMIASSALILCATLMLLAGVWFDGPAWVFIAAYLGLSLPSGAGPAAIANSKEQNPPEHEAVSIAVCNSMSYLGVSFFILVSGLILDSFPGQTDSLKGTVIYPGNAYAAVFGWLALMIMGSLVATFFIRESKGRNLHGPEVVP